MRSFDYSKLADRTWDNEIISYLSKIHEYKGKQGLFLHQKPLELERLTEIAKIQSTLKRFDFNDFLQILIIAEFH